MRNTKIVHQVTFKHMKMNKKRTILSITGIALMVMLLTCVFVGKDTAFRYFVDIASAKNGSYHYAVYNIDREKLTKIKELKGITEIAVTEDLKYSDFEMSGNPQKPFVNVRNYSPSAFEWMNIKLVDGRFPENGNEIVISEEAIKDGSAVKIGDKIKVKAYPKNSFTEAGNVPDGTPDEDGYYVKEIEVGEDAPAYLTKETAPANSAKFNAFFEAATKDITTKGTDRTFISGFSAGGKITAMAFKETKTYLMENNEASTSSTKAYIAKTYTVTVTTDKGTKTAYGLIQLRNPIIEGGEAKVDMSDDDKPSYTAYIYEKEENVKSRLENLNRNYSLIDVAAAPANTEKPAETTTKAEDKKPEETTTTKAA